MKRLRQGDVELLRINHSVQNPAALVPVAHDSDGATVLARGELTGHRHQITSSAAAELFEALEKDGPCLLHVTEPCDLEHEEHPPIRLRPGWYYVGVKRQYEPDGSWSPVAD